MSTSPRGQAEGEDMPLSRCIYCQERTSSSKTICNYCGYLKSIPQPKTGSSIPFLVTLTIVLSLGFYIASSRSYDSYCDPAISQAADDNPAIAGYCSPLTAR